MKGIHLGNMLQTW